MDQFTRVDVECSRVADELSIANGRLEQMRNECANLRAEKNIWESVQTRLVEENKALSMERAHLSDLMTNIQRMHSDLERSGENDRRRLEGQLQMLESQKLVNCGFVYFWYIFANNRIAKIFVPNLAANAILSVMSLCKRS
jgi:regulator of replication initiation timing